MFQDNITKKNVKGVNGIAAILVKAWLKYRKILIQPFLPLQTIAGHQGFQSLRLSRSNWIRAGFMT